MSQTLHDRSGGCLCGAVSYRAPDSSTDVLQCHCVNCRRLSGNYVAAIRTSTNTLEVTAEDGHFKWHDLDYAKYGFCDACGSTLFYRATARQHVTSVMVGTLDDASDLEMHSVWFADEAQPHNELPGGVPNHDGNG